MQITDEITIADIDEALMHLRAALQDYYGHRVSHKDKEFLYGQINDLLDARNELKADEGNSEGNIRTNA